MAESTVRAGTEETVTVTADPMATYGVRMAAGYDRGRGLRAEDVARWMAAARSYLPAGGGRILDLGAGTGRFSAALAGATGASVVACEPSAEMRAVCRSKVPEAT